MKTKTSQIIPLSRVVADENQPRKYFNAEKMAQLKESIKRFGVMSPIMVEQVGNNYLLVDGERRFRAATELKLKEIPAILSEPKNPTERLIEQFHIQEQHEGWSPAEKAVTLAKLSKELGVGITEACKLLGIGERLATNYIAFSRIIDKANYQKSEISIDYARPIQSLKNYVKEISIHALKKEFSKSDEKVLESNLVKKIRDGEITKGSELTRIKDALRKDPKVLTDLMKGDMTPNEMYLKTNAQGADYLRKVNAQAKWLGMYLGKFMENADVEVDKNTMSAVKTAYSRAKKFIDSYDSLS